MLGKLIKHEYKSTYKVYGGLLLVVVMVTLLSILSLKAPMWTSMLASRTAQRITSLDVLAIIMLITYIFTLIGIVWAFIIYSGVHFYRTMYTEQGYLTHTLPVNSHQIFVSKIIISGVWYLIINIAILVSIVAWLYMLINNIYVGSGEGSSLWALMMDNREAFAKMMKEIFGSKIGSEVVTLLLITPISLISAITILFGAITIGQLSQKHKVLMSIVSYIVITIVISIIQGIISFPITIRQSFELMANDVNSLGIGASTWVSVIVSLIAAISLYFISNYIVTKKLNLE